MVKWEGKQSQKEKRGTNRETDRRIEREREKL